MSKRDQEIPCENCKHVNIVPQALITYDVYQCVECGYVIDLRWLSQELMRLAEQRRAAAQR